MSQRVGLQEPVQQSLNETATKLGRLLLDRLSVSNNSPQANDTPNY